MSVLIFSTTSVSTFFILRRTERDIIKNVNWSISKVQVILVRFEWNLNFLHRFSKNTHIKFHKNAFSGGRVVPCGRTDGRTDRHDEVNSRISHLRTLLKTFLSWKSNNPPTQNFTGDRKKLDRSPIDQHSGMIRFYKNIRRSVLLVDTIFWHETYFYPNCLVMRESRIEKLYGYNKLLFYERYTACEPIRKMSSSNYHLFQELKPVLGYHKFTDSHDMETEVTRWLIMISRTSTSWKQERPPYDIINGSNVRKYTRKSSGISAQINMNCSY